MANFKLEHDMSTLENTILDIMLENSSDCVTGWPGEMDVADSVLDLVWAELAKDENFHWECIDQAPQFADLILDLAKSKPGASAALKAYVLNQYRNQASYHCHDLEGKFWESYQL